MPTDTITRNIENREDNQIQIEQSSTDFIFKAISHHGGGITKEVRFFAIPEDSYKRFLQEDKNDDNREKR